MNDSNSIMCYFVSHKTQQMSIQTRAVEKICRACARHTDPRTGFTCAGERRHAKQNSLEQTLLGASATAAAVSLRDNSSDPSLGEKRGFRTTNILYLGKTIKQLLRDVQVLLSNDNPIESFPNENILEKKIYKI